MRELDGDERRGWEESPAGIWLPAGAVNRPTGIDLFAGAGGMSLGSMQAGIQIVAAADNDPWSAITYMTNLGDYPCQFHFVEEGDEERLAKAIEKHLGLDKKGRRKAGVKEVMVSGSGWRSHHPDVPGVGHYFFGDVRKLTGTAILDAIGMEVGEVGCVMGGPPCQGFSTANSRRNELDPRNSLVFEFIRLVLEIRPKTMVMENVPGMLTMNTTEGVPVIDAICRVLEDGDFGTYESLRRSILSTAGCGAAVRTKRNLKPKRARRKRNRRAAQQRELFEAAWEAV